MNFLKNQKVKVSKIIELVVLVLIFIGLTIQAPGLVYPSQMPGIPKVTNSTPSTNAFISTWNTSLTSSGSNNSNQIQLPLVSNGTYNFMVDWGDGTSNSTITSYTQGLHNYTNAGVYTLIITGLISGWEFRNSGDVLKITSISQWGPLNLGNNGYYFWGASNLDITATDPLNLTGTTNLELAFESCTNLGSSGDFNSWNTSAVTSMEKMFDGDNNFNQPLNNWNVSHVISMSGMFAGDSAFNQPIGSWNVSQVTDMSYMFEGAGAFNQPIANWSVSHVTNMNSMFSTATTFNQSIGNWDVSQVTNMNSMFSLASAFNQPIGSWNVSQVTDMSFMFYWKSFNQPLGNWNVSQVKDMSYMFALDPVFNQNITSWNVLHVTKMNDMFDQDSAFNQPIGSWNVSTVNTMNSMFSQTSFNQSISNWDVSNVTDMSYMFYSNYAFNQNISTWNVRNVTTMAWMFCLSTFNQPIGNWDVSNVTDMSYMFYGDFAFNQSIGNWDVSSVTNMFNMFYDDYAFNQPLGAWNVSSVVWTGGNTGMIGMFTGDTLTIQNYDNLLIGWSNLTLQTGVEFDAGNSQYSYKAVNARQSIITNFGWYIIDAGEYNLTAPQSVQAFSGNKFIYLTWSSPSNNGGSAVTNYSIYRSTTSGTGFTLVNTTSATTFSYNDTGLVSQQTYYYIISATNGIGNRTNSTEVSAMTNTVPSAPQNLHAQAGVASVLLSWQAPVTDGGYTITGYNIYDSSNGGSSYTLVATVGPSIFTYNDTHFTYIGVLYYFEVNATNSQGIGLSPTAVNATPYTVSTPPDYFSALPGNTFVVLSWQLPIFTGGSTITSYSIYVSTNGGASYSSVATVSGSTYSYNDTGLINGQIYYFEASATNNAGSSPYSTAVSATPNGPITNPTTTPPTSTTGTSTSTISTTPTTGTSTSTTPTVSSSSNSNTQPTTSTTTITATAYGFLFIFPILSMIFIYFKRHKRN